MVLDNAETIMEDIVKNTEVVTAMDEKYVDMTINHMIEVKKSEEHQTN